MSRNLGFKFWENVVGKLEAHPLTNEEFSYVDSLQDIAKTGQDKCVLRFLEILVTNSENEESYFRNDMLTEVPRIYKGKSKWFGGS